MIQLRPQAQIPHRQIFADLNRVDVVRQQLAGLQVHQLAADAFGGDVEVEGALPVG